MAAALAEEEASAEAATVAVAVAAAEEAGAEIDIYYFAIDSPIENMYIEGHEMPLYLFFLFISFSLPFCALRECVSHCHA